MFKWLKNTGKGIQHLTDGKVIFSTNPLYDQVSLSCTFYKYDKLTGTCITYEQQFIIDELISENNYTSRDVFYNGIAEQINLNLDNYVNAREILEFSVNLYQQQSSNKFTCFDKVQKVRIEFKDKPIDSILTELKQTKIITEADYSNKMQTFEKFNTILNKLPQTELKYIVSNNHLPIYLNAEESTDYIQITEEAFYIIGKFYNLL